MQTLGMRDDKASFGVLGVGAVLSGTRPRQKGKDGDGGECSFHVSLSHFFAYTISSIVESKRTVRPSGRAFSDMMNVAVSMNASSLEHFCRRSPAADARNPVHHVIRAVLSSRSVEQVSRWVCF
jgi:hypothetical protein